MFGILESATHSPMAVNEPAPASTAATVMVKTTGSACRTPRGSRGSGTAPSVASSSPGASCRAAERLSFVSRSSNYPRSALSVYAVPR